MVRNSFLQCSCPFVELKPKEEEAFGFFNWPSWVSLSSRVLQKRLHLNLELAYDKRFCFFLTYLLGNRLCDSSDTWEKKKLIHYMPSSGYGYLMLFIELKIDLCIWKLKNTVVYFYETWLKCVG